MTRDSNHPVLIVLDSFTHTLARNARFLYHDRGEVSGEELSSMFMSYE